MTSVVKGQMQRAFNTILESIGNALISFLKGVATPLQMLWSAMLKKWRSRRYSGEYLLVSTVIAHMRTDPRLACLQNLPQDGHRLTMQEWYGILSFVREHGLWFPWESYFDDEDGGPFVKLDITKRFLVFSFCNITVALWRRRDLFTNDVLELVFSRFVVEPIIATRKDVRELLGLDLDDQQEEEYVDHGEDDQR